MLSDFNWLTTAAIKQQGSLLYPAAPPPFPSLGCTRVSPIAFLVCFFSLLTVCISHLLRINLISWHFVVSRTLLNCPCPSPPFLIAPFQSPIGATEPTTSTEPVGFVKLSRAMVTMRLNRNVGFIQFADSENGLQMEIQMRVASFVFCRLCGILPYAK